MKVLFVSNLFPNLHEPTRGVFNFHQVHHLSKFADVQVVAPVARSFTCGRYATTKPVPLEAELGGLKVWHPVSWYLPSLGTPFNAWLYASSVMPLIKRIHRDFPFDVILANWAYPDACGMARVARHFRVPLVASISGSDVNVQMTLPTHRWQILRMLRQNAATITRSRALKEVLVSRSADGGKIHVLYNGVDATRFLPMSRSEVRKVLQIPDDEQVVSYIGRLSPEKGVADLLEAMAILRDRSRLTPQLLVVGDGRQRAELVRLADSLGLQAQITWVGMKKNHELAPYYNAADIACVPSHMEGVPNTALEAMACGIPVVGTRVGGIPEVLTDATGLLVDPSQPKQLAAALATALSRTWDRPAIVAHSQQYSWAKNARTLSDLLRQVSY